MESPVKFCPALPADIFISDKAHYAFRNVCVYIYVYMYMLLSAVFESQYSKHGF